MLLIAAPLAACGNDRAEAPATHVTGEDAVERVEFPRYGAELEVPRSAELQRTPRPGVFRLFLGQPLVSMFAYPRKEQIPRKPGELRTARRRLVKEVRKRDPDYRLRRARVTEVAGANAIELLGDQTISRGELRTRSVHVYKRKAEYVVELLAPVEEFERTNSEVFEPLLRSLELSGMIKRRA
jgi:hypothetical protein